LRSRLRARGQRRLGRRIIPFTRDPALPRPTFDRISITEDRPVNGVYRGGSDHRKDGRLVIRLM
jgi:gamma-glutamyltranspeptidase/glutathione hydrolase